MTRRARGRRENRAEAGGRTLSALPEAATSHNEFCLVCFLIFAAAAGADGDKSQLRCIGFPSDVIRTFTAQSFRLNGGNGLTGRDKDIRPQGCALAQRAKAGPSEQTLFCQSRGFLKTVNVRYEFAFLSGTRSLQPSVQRDAAAGCTTTP